MGVNTETSRAVGADGEVGPPLPRDALFPARRLFRERGYSGSRRLRTSHLFEHRRIQFISQRPSRRAGEARLTARMVEEVPVDCGCGPADVKVQHPPGQALVRDGHGGDVQEGGEQRFKGEGGGAEKVVAVEGAAVVVPNGQFKGQVEKIGNYAYKGGGRGGHN